MSGTQGDWWNIARTEDDFATDNNPLESCGNAWDFIEQEFTICVKLPSSLDGVAADGLLNIYLRPALNNAYRNTFWPQDYNFVQEFTGVAKTDLTTGTSNLDLQISSGALDNGDNLRLFLIMLRPIPFLASRFRATL